MFAASPEEAIASPALREAVRQHPADTAVVVGMGGSSLWPDVLAETFGGTVTVVGTVEPEAITYDSSNNYTFQGGPIGGTGTLTKDGSGSLTINMGLRANLKT